MRPPRIWTLVWAGALLLSGLSARADQLAGTVKSVDLPGRKLVVTEKTTDKNIDVSVTAQTRIVTEAGQPVSLKNLKRGDGVGISRFNNGTAATILVNQSPLLGIVSTIDIDGKSLVITEKGTEREITVTIKSGTTIETTAGKVCALKNLKTGDGLSVTFVGDEARKVLVNVKPAELSAHVKSVAADLKSLIVTEIGSNTDVTVAITPQTAIVTNEGKTIELKKLKKGDGVGIAHDGSVASKIVVNVAPAR